MSARLCETPDLVEKRCRHAVSSLLTAHAGRQILIARDTARYPDRPPLVSRWQSRRACGQCGRRMVRIASHRIASECRERRAGDQA